MAYTPFTWHDGPGGNTPITAARLNAIEQGLADASEWAEGAQIESHNLGETDPPNGYYVRWANGFQKCFFVAESDFQEFGDSWRWDSPSWTYPSSFESPPLVTVLSQSKLMLSGSTSKEPPNLYIQSISTTGLFLDDVILNEASRPTLFVGYTAIGVWK